MISFGYYDSPIGVLKIGSQDGYIVSVKRVDSPDAEHHPTSVTDRAAAQILEYLQGQRRSFDLPLSIAGTPFQHAVWNAIASIPYGETRSYSQLAESVGKPKAVRAAGRACGDNPVWILIPCHRVVGKNGALTGYAGGTEMKRRLLTLEQKNKTTIKW